MKKRTRKAEATRRIIKVGETYRDVNCGALVTVEDHEIVGGKRTGGVIVIGAGAGEHVPRRWVCPAEDLAEMDAALPAAGAQGRGSDT
jgi:hypothetical protein